MGRLLACLAVLVLPGLAAADTGPDELAAGVAARTAVPPDLTSARVHFAQAGAGADDRSAAEALYFLGEMDDLDLDFKSALAHYVASAARLPSSRYTPRANSRASELRTHAEGDFVPLVHLETVRRSPALSNDATAIDALVREAAGFPPGKVRVEARMLAAEAYLGRLRRRDEGLPLLRLVIDDPKADVLLSRAAASELVHAYVAKQDLASALEITRRYPKLLEPKAERTIVRLMRRRPLRIAAMADLALLAAFALLALARPGRAEVVRAVRRVAPMALLFTALACFVGGFLASRYEQTSPYPFTAMFPAMFAVALLSRAWSAAGSPSPPARVLRAIASFAGVFAAAFLMLDRMDPIYLQGFGL
jgi:hypothetical protein